MAAAGEGLKIGLVTDVGEVDDRSFNQSAWEGVQAAVAALNGEASYIETQDSTDYANNIAEFADNGYDIIVTVGFALGEATVQAAADYPDIYFIGVDQFQGETLANVTGLIFHEDQAGYLAGVLAARLTTSGTVAGVYGTDLVPPVVAYARGLRGWRAGDQPRHQRHHHLPPRWAGRGLHRPRVGRGDGCPGHRPGRGRALLRWRQDRQRWPGRNREPHHRG